MPSSLRQASYGLGATKWQTIWHHVLPNALPGILTGTILAMSRAIGETAPLVVVGASTFITVDPNGPFAKFTTLPIQIYQWTSRPQDEFRNIAAAAILVLLALLLALNASAVLLRNRYSRRISSMVDNHASSDNRGADPIGQTHTNGNYAIEARGLCVYYGDFRAVKACQHRD